MIRIILIDDHTLVRDGIRTMLQGMKNMQVIGEASTGIEGIQLARELQPNIVILDLKLPDISGLETMTRLMRLQTTPKILMLSSAIHAELLSRAIETGALGYITKSCTREELISAIQTVHKGQGYLCTEVASRLALAKIDHKKPAIFSELSQKEMEVLLLSARCLSSEDIAKRLHMSPKTVHSYRSRIFEKIGTNNNVALTLRVIREGLITLDEADN